MKEQVNRRMAVRHYQNAKMPSAFAKSSPNPILTVPLT